MSSEMQRKAVESEMECKAVESEMECNEIQNTKGYKDATKMAERCVAMRIHHDTNEIQCNAEYSAKRNAIRFVMQCKVRRNV
jgi:hypothetical protein